MSDALAILGGGQLGRMIALAAAARGIRCVALDPNPHACAGDVCRLITGQYDDPAALDKLAKHADAVTFEFENIPPAAIELAKDRFRVVRPGLESLVAAADRLSERRTLQAAGIDVAPFAVIDQASDIRSSLDQIGAPAILKRRAGGYDGKGQTTVASPDDAERAFAAIGNAPAILERRIPFTRELSVVLCRDEHGATAAYPIVENTHSNGILVRSVAPAAVDSALERRVVGWTEALASSLGHIGVLTLELFDTPDGPIANEFAPRVHNSGHWTIEGAATSQFENHARAVLGLPLGPTHATGVSIMHNIIGSMPARADALAIDGCHLHDYGKPPKPGRKLGHLTCTGRTREETDPAATAAARLLASDPSPMQSA